MEKMEPSNYDMVNSLLENCAYPGCRSQIHTVLGGRCAGCVFVDDPLNPSLALIQANMTTLLPHWSYLVGEAEPASVRQFLFSLLIEHLPIEGVTIFAGSPALSAELDLLFHRNVTRRVFSYPRTFPPVDHMLDLPTCAHIEPMSGETLKEYRVSGNSDGFGFCCRIGGERACHCYSEYVGGGEAEITIFTEGKYQRQGLAIATARAFIEECFERGLRPAWSCDSDNLASAAAARKLGFVEGESQEGYYIHKAFLLWRDAATGKFGPNPDIEPSHYTDSNIMETAQNIVRQAIEACVSELHAISDSAGTGIWNQTPTGPVEAMRLSPAISAALIAHWKALTDMNIHKQGLRQAGRCIIKLENREYVLRLRVEPSAYGETIRIAIKSL